MYSQSKYRIQQRGLTTLLVTLLLFLGATLVLLFVNRGAVLEQRLSANEVRAKQAFAAANAGLDHALAYMQKGGVDQNNDGIADAIASTTLVNSGGANTPSFYRATYCDVAANPPPCPNTSGTALACVVPASLTRVLAYSCGWSDDNTSVQRIVQVLQGTISSASPVSTPLVSRGTANLLVGGASVLNYFNDLTVWSGGSLLGQSMTGKTFIRETAGFPFANDSTDTDHDGISDYRDTGGSPACLNPPTGYTCSTQGSTLGHDTISGDTSLATSSSTEFFQRFFTKTPSVYRDTVATWTVDLNNSLTSSDSTNINSINNMGAQVIWVEGDVTSLPDVVGTEANPVILIVNGDLALGSNNVINGLVYTTGTLTSVGTPTIYGALIVAGAANATGNLKIVYDPKALGNVTNIGQAARVPGAFRDW